MLIHNVKITVFVKPEDPTDIKLYSEIFKKFAPINYSKDKISTNIEIVDGLENRKIKIISLELSKEAHTNLFIKTLKEFIGQDACKLLSHQKESRLDEDLYFYIRLDRKLALNSKWKLTDSGDCIHLRLSLAAFPKNKESSLRLIDKIFL